jgi:hypothetical protein
MRQMYCRMPNRQKRRKVQIQINLKDAYEKFPV